MKKILNKDVSNVVDEMLLGYLTAYKSFYKKVDGFNAFYYRGHREKKVALVVGGVPAMSRCSQDSVVPDLQMQLHVEMYVHHPIRS